MKIIIFAYICFFSFSSFAGDYSEYSKLGFSSDEKFYAFETTISRDGSGFTDYIFHILDISKNKYQEILKYTEKGNKEDKTLLKNYKKKKLKLLTKYMIENKKQGTVLLFRPHTDQQASQLKETTFTIAPGMSGIGSQYALKKYHLSLKSIEVKDETKKRCMGFPNSKAMKLSLYLNQTPLQVDEKIPNSRGCAFNYRINEVIVQNNQIIIFLDYLTAPGFEGNNFEIMAISKAYPFN